MLKTGYVSPNPPGIARSHEPVSSSPTSLSFLCEIVTIALSQKLIGEPRENLFSGWDMRGSVCGKRGGVYIYTKKDGRVMDLRAWQH